MKIQFTNIDSYKVLMDKSFEELTISLQHLFIKYNIECSFMIVNDPSNDNYPLFSPLENTIYVNVKNFSIQQFIYQLSHEMMHQLTYNVAMIKTYDGKVYKSSEVLCCAFSWFILKKLDFIDYLFACWDPRKFKYKEWWAEIFIMYHELDDDYEGCIYKYIDLAVQDLKSSSNT